MVRGFARLGLKPRGHFLSVLLLLEHRALTVIDLGFIDFGPRKRRGVV
jgi:hypothetical protein